MVSERLEEVLIVVGDKLGGYSQEYVCRRVVLAQVLEVAVGSKLDITKGVAGPNLMHKTSGRVAAPRAASIALLVELELLRAVPDAKGLDGGELVALCVGKACGGNVVGDLVQ